MEDETAIVAIQNQRLTSETVYCSEICYSCPYTFENVMFIDLPSKSLRRREKAPTSSKRAMSNEVEDVISQIQPRFLRERNIFSFS